MVSFFKKFFSKPDYAALLANGAIVLDVRTPREYANGAIPNSTNITLNDIAQNVSKIADYKKPIICVCASGVRSGMAKSILKRKGIEAYNAGPWTNLIVFTQN